MDQFGVGGKGDSGQLGNGEDDNQNNPVQVIIDENNNLEDMVQVASGQSHSCALKSDGTVWCWGDGDDGQLGDGDLDAHNSLPTQVKTSASNNLTDVMQIAVGLSHTCAIKSDTTMVCWGNGHSGQLGYGAYSHRAYAVSVSNLTDVVQISGGSSTTCAVNSSGRAFCWGASSNGLLSHGDTSNKGTPQAVKENATDNLENVRQISIGWTHACAVFHDGTGRCWGNGDDGRLGDGHQENRLYPVLVTGLDYGLAQVTTGGVYSCGVNLLGEVLCWGGGNYGRLGNGSNENKSTPTLVRGDSSTNTLNIGSYRESLDCAIEGGGCTPNSIVLALGSGLSSPGNSAPVDIAVSGIVDGQTLSFYSDDDCSTQVGSDLSASGTISAPLSLDGTFHFYYKVESNEKVLSCSNSSLTYVFETILPNATGVSIADGTYNVDDELEFRVTFDEKVLVMGTPRLHIIIGDDTRYASYSTGSGTDELVFSYQIQATDDSDSDGVDLGNSSSIDLNLGEITDIAGNAGTGFTLSTTSFSAVIVEISDL